MKSVTAAVLGGVTDVWRAASHMKQIKTSANWKEPPINSPGAHSGFKTLQYLLRGQEGGAKAVQKLCGKFLITSRRLLL